MGIAFDAPLALLLLIPALGLTFVLYGAARRRTGKGRRRVALALRALLLVSLVFALAGFRLVLPIDRLATVYVVDLSDSVGEAGREDALAFVRQSLALMPEGDAAGIVAFGKGALVERLPAELREIDRIASAPVKSATDIGSALRLASALFPDDAQKRIVLLSDGNDTTGQGQAEAALAAARGIQVETRVIGLGTAQEVIVERLTTPSTSRLGETVEVVADINSTVAQPATVRLFANGVQVGVERVDLEQGANKITFDPVKPQEAGFVRFRAVVEAAQNTFSQNDRADSNTIVQGEPRILVVTGDESVASELVKALEVERQNVDTVAAAGLPSDPLQLASYDSVVLVDVPKPSLTDRQMAALQVYVRDLGKGLVMIGGPRSYGAGGYQKTPIEETLPVDMGVRDRQKQPDIALVVVIDKSGSMDACHCNSFQGGMGGPGIAGVRKVDIGKEAILRAAAAMTARDELGVVAFDQAAHWVVKTQPLGGISNLQGNIAGIQPLGQTNIFAGLEQAVTSLEGTAATRRHIILLTDGWSSSGQYDAIIARMKAAGITLSTVGAGGGSNPFLQQLAKQGGGRFYPAANPASIPDIFLKETQQVSGQQIVEETFHPIITSSSPILRGLDQGFPQLLGYNGTTAKPAAQTVLVTARDDPLLAQWQFGLGRSVAWTSDSTGRWARSWIGWDGFSKFFSQLVGWTFPGEETAGIEASLISEGTTTKLRVESVAEDGSPRDFYTTGVAITAPDLTSKAIGLVQVAPGVYEAPLGEIDAGAYIVRVSQTRSGSTPLGRTLGLVAPTPAEYRLLGSNQAFLATLRAATGGRAIETAAQPWTHDLATTDSYTDLWPTLLILALLLWPLDIALRRVAMGRRELADARRWLAGGWRRRAAVAPRPTEVAGMLAARNRAAGSSARAALLRGDVAAAGEPAVSVVAAAAPTAPGPTRAGPPRRTNPAPDSGPAARLDPTASPAPSAAHPEPPAPAPPPDDPTDTITRLRDAKRRARGG